MNFLKTVVASAAFVAGSMFVGQAFGLSLDTDSDEYLGYYTPGEPANAATEASNINTLLDQAINTTTTIGSFTYVRDDGDCSPIVCPDATATGAVKDETTGNVIDLGDGWMYLIGKYDGPNGGSLVWYVGDLTGSIDILQNWGPLTQQFGLSHWTLFNPNGNGGGPGNGNGNGNNVPEPGTLALFGLALAGAGLMRRRRAS